MPPPPCLLIEDRDLSLGRIYDTEVHEHTFRILNPTATPVTITRFNTSCDCLGITPPDGVVSPGEAKEFTIRLAPARRGADVNSASEGESEQLRFRALCQTDGQPQTVDWQLTYTILPTIRIKPAVVSIGIQSERHPGVEANALVEAADAVERVECDAPEKWSVSVWPENGVSRPRRFRIHLKALGPLDRGTITVPIKVHPVDADGQRLPWKEFHVRGEVGQDVVPEPTGVYLGRQRRGSVADEAIRLRSLLGRAFRVQAVNCGTKSVAIKQLEGGQAFSLRVPIEAEGEQAMDVRFTVEESDGRSITVILPIRYYGVGEE